MPFTEGGRIQSLFGYFSLHIRRSLRIRDVEELNNKLVSDKAKVREDGFKTLQNFLQSTGDSSLWTLLDGETARLDHHGRICCR
ncbi:hypothetical protein R1flu_026663 [Riccia fluitans]|uniref:Uncharacterized protein n=1 Tax=Riccia fluitans TaxID=41844 RepID=A0ABD1XGJ9_9MARC